MADPISALARRIADESVVSAPDFFASHQVWLQEGNVSVALIEKRDIPAIRRIVAKAVERALRGVAEAE